MAINMISEAKGLKYFISYLFIYLINGYGFQAFPALTLVFPITRRTRQFFPNDGMDPSIGSGSNRIRGPENCRNRYTKRCGYMHRAGVIGYQQPRPFNDSN